jgi:hypothetical protein
VRLASTTFTGAPTIRLTCSVRRCGSSTGEVSVDGQNPDRPVADHRLTRRRVRARWMKSAASSSGRPRPLPRTSWLYLAWAPESVLWLRRHRCFRVPIRHAEPCGDRHPQMLRATSATFWPGLERQVGHQARLVTRCAAADAKMRRQ